RSTNNNNPKLVEQHFQDVVGSIVLLAQRLSVHALSGLLNIKITKVIMCLRPLHSVILVPKEAEGELRTFHLSFHDYITNTARCKDPTFCIDSLLHHRRLALCCLKRMQHSLKRDICGIGDAWRLKNEVEDLEMKKATHLPPDLRYAIL